MKKRCAWLVVPAVLGCATAALADTITVCLDGSCDHTSVQDAIDAAKDGDVIHISPGLYAHGSPINPDGKQIVISGTEVDGVPATILDGNESHRVIICGSGEDESTLFENLIVQNGLADEAAFGGTVGRGGGMLNNGSSPTIKNCIFRNNVALQRGGGMANRGSDSASHPQIVDCVFLNNQSTSGGGIRNDDGSSPVISNCLFQGNKALEMGGGWEGDGGAIGNAYYCNPIISACQFIDNETDGNGGALSNNNYGQVAMVDCILSGNLSSLGGGGAIYTADFGTTSLSLRNCVICGNTKTQVLGTWEDLGGNCIEAVCKECPTCPDSDGDGVCDEFDQCPGEPDSDTDADGVVDCLDECPLDPNKIEPGRCGCGVVDTTVAGDFDCDGDFDTDDYEAMKAALGICPGDLDGNGIVNGADLTIILGFWGPCP